MEKIEINLENLTTDEREQLMGLFKRAKGKNNERWKPKHNNTYWVVGEINNVKRFTWTSDNYDNAYLSLHNCFKTEEEAKFEAERRATIAELQNYADEYNREVDWSNFDLSKYFLRFNLRENKIRVVDLTYVKQGDVFFSSKEIALGAIEKIGADRLKKYYFQIED